jgi:HlyD family secretion protein
MHSLTRWVLILAVLGIAGWGIAGPFGLKLFQRKPIDYREAEVSRGRIVAVVNSTGTVKPTRTVTVGTFVSGPIKSIAVDHNTEVKEGELLAKIDARIYKAAVDRDQATLAFQEANVNQAKAKWKQAVNDELRSQKLQEKSKGFISASEMDQYKFNRQALESQVAVMEAAVKQAQASLDTSLLNFGYTEIRSPVDGLVIDRKVDPGQTVAASFQTPDLFVVALDMRKEMYVFASVDETDIGLVEAAQTSGQPVRFTVDAYPDELFVGKIHQVRKNSTTTQNVVTYPVIVSAANPDRKLLPGMTASISFQVGERTSVLRVPNAALRYFPPREQVRPEDRKLLEGTERADAKDEQAATSRSADEIAESRRLRNRRHVWVVDGLFLRAVEVITGLSDSRFTEIVSGELTEGQKLVTGVRPKE